MKFGLLTYEERSSGKFNVGDHIQSLAAKQYLPKVDRLIQRDHLNNLNLKEKTSVIMNGWYTHRPENWPPEELLNPLFISFHLNSSHAEKVLNKIENINYLKKHEPIGCRDTGTKDALTKYGIKAYYSSCLTTTLDLKYKTDQRTDEILIVDILYKDDFKKKYKENPKRILIDLLRGRYKIMKDRFKKSREREETIKRMIPQDILNKGIYLTHSHFNKKYTEEEKFKLGEGLIQKYAKAKLVITSRIHCALPCLALGTPVIFIAGGELFHKSEMSRLKGTIEHLNILSTDKMDLNQNISDELNILDINTIDWNTIQNPTSYAKYTEVLKETCSQFVKKHKSL